MGTTFYHGRRVTTTDTGVASVISGQQRFYIPSNLGTQMIAYAMGFLGGRYYLSGNAQTRMGIASGGSSPGSLIAYTNEITVSNPSDYGGNLQPQTSNLTSPVLLNPGSLALGITSRNGELYVGMRQASEISEANENFYTKNGLGSTVPTNPVGGTQEYNGHLDVWIIGVTNTAPNVPTNLSPSGQLLGSDTTPVLTSYFSDAEQVLPNGVAYDYLNMAHIQVRRKSDGVLFWDHSYSVTPNERNGSYSQIEYAGTSLVAGTDYEWRVRHSDRAGAWSGFSGWVTFNINPGGSVSTPSSPSGKQLTTTPGPFVAQWTHVAALSTNAVQVELLQGGNIVKTSPLITQTVAPNGNISITWAQSTFAGLTPGVGYTYRIRGRDTGGAYSPWSNEQSISINAVPNTPTGLTPSGSNPTSSYPLLRFSASDPDDATGSLTGTVELTRADNSVVTRTATYNASTGFFEYQTTATDIPSYQTMRWRAKVSDGTYASPWSSQATFIYGAGPVVTVTYPTPNEVVPVSSPTITWTATGQVSRRVRVYRQSDDVLVYDSGGVGLTLQFATIPVSILRHGGEYYVTVAVTNSAPLTGTSEPVPFTVLFPQPAMIQGFNASPSAIGSDSSPTAIDLSWEQTTFPASQFIAYNLYRRSLSPRPEDGDGEILLRRITSPMQTTFTDYHPRSGVTYEYTLRQVIQVDLDSLESEPATSQAGITLEGIVIASATSPSVYRADLRYLAQGENLSMPLRIDERQAIRLGARKGRTIRSKYRAWEPSGRFVLLTDQYATADERVSQLREAVLEGRTFSFRDFTGRKLWVTVTGYNETPYAHRFEVDLKFREEDFREGERV